MERRRALGDGIEDGAGVAGVKEDDRDGVGGWEGACVEAFYSESGLLGQDLVDGAF
jgi:hypothetical protein